MHIEWVCKKFDDLTTAELYTILRLRIEVFVVEQNCVFQDADNKDQPAHHLMGFSNGQLVAYTRLLNAGTAYDKVSIGRVVTNPKYRNTGIGKLLMEKSIDYCTTLFGKQDIKIGAQFYLKKFYESFGFIQTSTVYDEDGIDHIEMIKYAHA
jgi:ElaA protein